MGEVQRYEMEDGGFGMRPLERCPFCGDVADPEVMATSRGWVVTCLDLECGAAGPLEHDQASAARKWNDRATLLEADGG